MVKSTKGLSVISEEYIEKLAGTDTVEVLKQMKEILNKSFGEENNQISPPTIESIKQNFIDIGYNTKLLEEADDRSLLELMERDGYGYTIVIKFPEVLIKNSRGRKHDIKDLYVKFQVGERGLFKYGLLGTRTTLTEDEYEARYLHSHLPGFWDGPYGFSHFCTGSGEINQVMSLLSEKYDEINFTLFCLHLKNYVAWESLEGNPHMHISEIGLSRNNYSTQRLVISDTILNKVVNILKSELFSNLEELKRLLKISISSSSINVSTTDDFEKWVADYITKVDYTEIYSHAGSNEWLLCYKSRDQYIPINHVRRRREIVIPTKPVITFKGEPKFLTIIKKENEEEIQAAKFINPAITEKFCSDLTRNLTKIAISTEYKGVEEQKDTIVNIREVAEPDIFSM